MKFIELNLLEDIQKGIDALGFETPTPVQELTIPVAIQGKDVQASAQTGTGKTCAFTLPLLQKISLQEHRAKPSALILVPTRELGAQVHAVIKEVGRFTDIKAVLIMGGVDFRKQVKQIQAGVDIVVATPGRLLDHMSRGTFRINKIHTLILDEADRMLDMGFMPDINRILSMCPKEKQTMLFSATFPPAIQKIVARFLNDPAIIDLGQSKPSENIQHVLYPISRRQKEEFIKFLLEEHHMASALVFCKTKTGSDLLARFMEKLGLKVGVIHSNFSQAQRDKALQSFKERKFQLLVATDIASRGLDIKDVTHVINFDVPENPEDYVHRIGRTGRADAQGDAFTLMAPDEETYVRRIERLIGKTIKRAKIDRFPYLVQPRLTPPSKSTPEGFGKMRRKIPTGRGSRFRR